MGLWLKCPGCQTTNPLPLRACLKCGQSLDNIPKESRVYVIGAAAAVAPPAHPAPRPQAAVPMAAEAPAAPKPAKQPKKPRKKKG